MSDKNQSKGDARLKGNGRNSRTRTGDRHQKTAQPEMKELKKERPVPSLTDDLDLEEYLKDELLEIYGKEDESFGETESDAADDEMTMEELTRLVDEHINSTSAKEEAAADAEDAGNGAAGNEASQEAAETETAAAETVTAEAAPAAEIPAEEMSAEEISSEETAADQIPDAGADEADEDADTRVYQRTYEPKTYKRNENVVEEQVHLDQQRPGSGAKVHAAPVQPAAMPATNQHTAVTQPATAGAAQIIRNSRDEEEEIDLIEILFALRKRIVLILVLGIIFAAGAFGITRFFITPTYTSTAQILVLTKETTIASLADLQIGSQLTNDYTVLIQSRPVLQEVVDNLDLDMTYRDLRKLLTITNPSSTRILQLTIEATDPVLAKQIVDEVSTVSSAYIADRMEVTPPKIIEDGEIPESKSSPNTMRNVALGLLIGMLLGAAIAVIEQLLNDTIVSDEDIEKYLGLVVLANIPNKDQADTSRTKKSIFKRKERA